MSAFALVSSEWALSALATASVLLAWACQRERKWFPKSKSARWIVVMLLGERNAANLYGENNAAEQFKQKADRCGATVVAIGDKAGYQPLLARVVYPLADSEQKEGEEKQKCVSLWDEFNISGNASDHSAGTDAGKCVPPTIDLQPGERISHAMIKTPMISQ